MKMKNVIASALAVICGMFAGCGKPYGGKPASFHSTEPMKRIGTGTLSFDNNPVSYEKIVESTDKPKSYDYNLDVISIFRRKLKESRLLQ
ncbi:MAG: hypothetical protein K6E19_00490 [Lachnospiraceae bacterium]|nr:hypothetical protein [Lachnospiraceae bacterium]